MTSYSIQQQSIHQINHHEIMALFVLRKFILQTRMCRHPVRLDVWFLVGPFVYFHTLCVRTAKALARLRGWTGSPEPSLVAYAISTIISWAGSNYIADINRDGHLTITHAIYEYTWRLKKSIEKPRKCRNHKLQPTPNIKRKRKRAKTNTYKTNKQMQRRFESVYI